MPLTAKEYALLEFLVLNEDRVVGREQIAQNLTPRGNQHVVTCSGVRRDQGGRLTLAD